MPTWRKSTRRPSVPPIITRQLLAFARKQTIAPKVLDLNETVAGMLKMLRRLIGEDIELVWLPGRDLWPVKMDPAQIDQILANLCVNARDAIDGCRHRSPSRPANVVLDDDLLRRTSRNRPRRIRDFCGQRQRCGMDAKRDRTHLRAVFHHQGSGKGTGLGLATVYGIVKQNNGFISVYSEPGKGTTFKIYLPRSEVYDLATHAGEHRNRHGRGTETILLVEDDPEILDLGQTMLEKLGYQYPGGSFRRGGYPPGGAACPDGLIS